MSEAAVKVLAIVAMDESRVIGNKGALPWNIPADMAHFRSLTMGGVVLMGRKTWESLPAAYRPLPGRKNVVVSRNADRLGLPPGVLHAPTPEDAVSVAKRLAELLGKHVWVIGGAELYRVLLPLCDEVHLTVVAGTHQGDAWLPEFESSFKQVSEQQANGCAFQVYTRRA